MLNLSADEEEHFRNREKDKILHRHLLDGINVILQLTDVPLNTYGIPVALLQVHDGAKWIPDMSHTINILKHKYRIKFTATCNCYFNLQIRHGTETDNMTIQVRELHQICLQESHIMNADLNLYYSELLLKIIPSITFIPKLVY